LQDPGRPLTLDGRGDAGDVATAPAEVVEAARDPLTVCMLLLLWSGFSRDWQPTLAASPICLSRLKPLLQVHGDWTGALRGQ
jgi:hypothetical protein